MLRRYDASSGCGAGFGRREVAHSLRGAAVGISGDADAEVHCGFKPIPAGWIVQVGQRNLDRPITSVDVLRVREVGLSCKFWVGGSIILAIFITL